MFIHRMLAATATALIGLTGYAGETSVCDGTELLEGEPTCFLNYIDNFNGGPLGNPPSYATIECGDAVCGRTGTYIQFFIEVRDEDWYRLMLTHPMELTWEVTADGFPHAIAMRDLALPGGPAIGPILTSVAGETLTVTNRLEPGDYAFWVSTAQFTGVPCGAQYTASLTSATACELPTPLGACCLCNVCYDDVDEGECLSSGGQAWYEDDQCSFVQCPDVDGAQNCFCGPGSGSCYVNNGSPNCDDCVCSLLICDMDPFCCETSWDQVCADLAIERCTCEADFDRSGDVGFGDVLIMIGRWGQCIGCPQDFDFSGAVDFTDLLHVLGLWGPCPPPI